MLTSPVITRDPEVVGLAAGSPPSAPQRSTRVMRQRRVLVSAGFLAGLAAVAGLATGSAAAWGVMAVVGILGLAYVGAVARMRRLAERRELAHAFGEFRLGDANWRELAGDFAVGADGSPDTPVVVVDSPLAVVRFLAAYALAGLLTPVVAIVRLGRGHATDLGGQGFVDRLVRARQYALSHSVKVLSASAVATAGVTTMSLAANASIDSSPAATALATKAAATATPLVPTVATSVTTGMSSYTVQPGDTLSAIAQQYGVTVGSLAAANGIANPNQITAGDVLHLQLAPYPVRLGDTLSAIGARYGRSVSELAAVNRIANPNLIFVGQVFQVGGGQLPAVPHLVVPASGWGDPAPADAAVSGNGPAAHTAAAVAPDTPPLVGSGTYTVQVGDTLAAIAARFDTWTETLVQANHLADPDLITAGEVLQVGGQGANAPKPDPPKPDPSVPAPAVAAAHTAAAVAPDTPPLVGSGTYTVRAGDTLAAIAARFDTWTETLIQANHLTDPDLITAGEVLQVGGRGANAPKPDPRPIAHPPAHVVVAPRAVSRRAPHVVAHVVAPAEPAAPPLIGSGTYTVQAGDTLAAIAARFDTWTETLVQANHLASADVITVGEVLQVGGRGANAPRPAPRPAPAPAPVVRAPVVTAIAPPPMSSFEACVIRTESGGNPQVVNASGHWGLFQFSESTWIEYGGSPSAFGHASAAVQEQIFANAIADGGASNWTPYDGC